MKKGTEIAAKDCLIWLHSWQSLLRLLGCGVTPKCRSVCCGLKQVFGYVR